MLWFVTSFSNFPYLSLCGLQSSWKVACLWATSSLFLTGNIPSLPLISFNRSGFSINLSGLYIQHFVWRMNVEAHISDRKHKTKQTDFLLLVAPFQFLLNFQTLYSRTDWVVFIWQPWHLFCRLQVLHPRMMAGSGPCRVYKLFFTLPELWVSCILLLSLAQFAGGAPSCNSSYHTRKTPLMPSARFPSPAWHAIFIYVLSV